MKLRMRGISETSVLKDKIQSTLRQIVMKRDGGCILRKIRFCGGEIGETTIQADHLITRANNATYADSRLVVCVCRACHGWKQWNKEQYDFLVKKILPKETVKLWEDCERDSWKPRKTGVYDWKLALLVLQQELKGLSP